MDIQDTFMLMPLVMVSAYLLDLVLGDPKALPHPVRWIGGLISFVEGVLRRRTKTPEAERLAGAVLCAAVVGTVVSVSLALLYFALNLSATLFFLLSVYLSWTALSLRSLGDEARGVVDSVKSEGLPAARKRLSAIVGRDTDALDEEGVMRAAVETVSENTSDGVIAPLFYLAIGGPVLALAYKAVNTLDSMVGYRNEQYENLGRFSARLDDFANYLPARITALLMVVSSYLLGLDGRAAFGTFRRDGRAHPSPNAGLPQAAMAGALGVRLGGPATYGGAPGGRPFIGGGVGGGEGGEGGGPVGPRTVEQTTRVMHLTSLLMLVIVLSVYTLLSRLLAG
ncbi:MAG: adenosylcobinamide-phosphate synthase CbiB [Candidatus Binatia bacterium]